MSETIYITFSIELPEGTSIRVNGPTQHAVSDEPPLPEPPSDIPARSHTELAQRASAEVCPVHNKPWKTVPAGISRKDGKEYQEFRACPEFGCKERPR